MNVVIGVLKSLLYIKVMSLLKVSICMLLALSLVGCAVSRNPNPIIRYAANTGATLAGPGFAVMCVAGSLDDEDHSNKDIERLGVTGLAAAAGGFAIGAILGGTVGFFKWMFNGFQDDNMARAEPLPEDILPPERDNEYGGRL